MSSSRYDLDHFTKRLLTECLEAATKAFWLRRAQQLEAARPRVGEFHGQASIEDLRARWSELTEQANACRARARVAPLDEIHPDVENVWQEAS